MKKGRIVLCMSLLLSGAVLFIQTVSPDALSETGAGEKMVPEELRRPQYGEDPRFPRDYAIGELGRGDAPEAAYRRAVHVTGLLASGGAGELQLRPGLEETISSLAPRSSRVGGGRNEADGSVSFLVRFMGREEAVTGELYLRQEERPQPRGDVSAAPDAVSAPDLADAWQMEDLLLEEKRPVRAGAYGPDSADLKPYQRFF